MWFGSSPSCEKELPRRSRVFTVRPSRSDSLTFCFTLLNDLAKAIKAFDGKKNHLYVSPLSATRRRRCLLRSVWVRSHASMAALCDLGSWLGRSWVSAMCFVASLTLLYGLLFVSCLLLSLFYFVLQDET